MKILLAGEWQFEIYERAFADALESCGMEVIPFSWNKYFQSSLSRLESKWTVPGPATFKLNRDFLYKTKKVNPDVILLWRNTHIWPSTLERIKSNPKPVMVSYNHDDFSGPADGVKVPLHHHLYWRHFLAGARHFDLHLVKRQLNIEHLKSLGADRCMIFRMYYVPEIHRPVALADHERNHLECDVVFAGHYEPDGRMDFIRALVKAGLHVKLFGGKYWTRSVLGDLADYFGEIYPVYGDYYTKALCGAKMCLCFLSKINRDTHTKRCFEIPACGKLLLSERSRDLQEMFKEDEEAVFFSTPEELVEKAIWLKNNPDEIQRIAIAGMNRVYTDGHSIYNRTKEFINELEQIKLDRNG